MIGPQSGQNITTHDERKFRDKSETSARSRPAASSDGQQPSGLKSNAHGVLSGLPADDRTVAELQPKTVGDLFHF